MKYNVEFEMHSDLSDSISEVVSKALQSAFGSIDKLRVVPVTTYVGRVQQDQTIIWNEVRHGE